ncbi:type 2 lanthipeptide synthetase LanM [Clostridium perfringens]|uniref:type 2 lanthipeptide synthetase LanM n=1 Tax=Clostridium perfringens TaxID=1502 RepID=UPI002FCD5069|nr:type 2 lantipeptide synthetase LanM [Clostridium perfringens]
MRNTEKENYNYCVHITQNVIKDRTGIFDEVYYDFILKLVISINEYLLSLNIDKELKNKESVLLSIGKSFKNVLIDLLEKTLISELYNNKTNLKGNTSEERYDYFVNHYMKINRDKIFNESSIIMELVNLNIKNIVSSVNEFFERLKNDAYNIEKKLDVKIYDLKEISMSCGDTHNNGRTVFLLTLENQKKLLYKPHSLKNDFILENIIRFINSKCKLKYNLKTVDTLDCGNYGWQKFVESNECKTIEEVKNYMYRFGELICLCYALNTNDLHFENIIASGEYPIIIDSETLSYNSSFFRSNSIDEFGGILKFISNSVYSSVLLPQNLEFNPKKLELSAIAGGYTNQTYTINTVTNKGTDKIQFNYKEVSINDTQELKNIVTLNGKKINILDYVEDIIEGFKAYYNVLLENKNELIEFMNIDEFFDGEYRQVLRATALYSKYLKASYHPYYTIDKKMREKVFNCLNVKSSKFEKQNEMIEAEKLQLNNDDIPYFFAKYNSLDLYTYTSGTISNFYTKTIKDLIIDKIKSLSIEDLDRQELFIRFSLCSLKTKSNISKDIKKVNQFKEVNYTENFEETIYKLLISMDSFLNRLYSITSEDKKFYSFYNLSDSEEGYVLGGIKPTLYEGAGIALYYTYLWEYTKDNQYKSIANRILEMINSYDYDYFAGNIGVFSGLSTLAYVNYNMYKVFKDKQHYIKYKEILSKLLKENLKEIEEIDVTNGLSGVIIMLLNIYKIDSSEIETLNLAKKYGEALLDKIKLCEKNINTGFAHGLSGISLALVMLSNFTQNNKYYEEALVLINKENKYYLEKENSWIDLREERRSSPVHWCYGATGILVSRTLMLDYINIDDIDIINRDIVRCIDKLIKDGLSKEMLNNLCHGNIGNLDVLLTFAIKTNNKTLNKIVMENSKKIIKEIINNGVNVSNPVACINIDFMTGLSGVMYFLLRLLNKEIPSILYLESKI